MFIKTSNQITDLECNNTNWRMFRTTWCRLCVQCNVAASVPRRCTTPQQPRQNKPLRQSEASRRCSGHRGLDSHSCTHTIKYW